MIDKALLLLQGELVSYLSSKKDDAVTVVIDNVGLFETSDGASLTDNIIITLVNIEEESALKNQSTLRRSPPNNVVYENTPVFLNLYVLITCNYSGEKYVLALRRLSLVIQFLQSKTSFSYTSSAAAASLSDSADPPETDLLSLKFTLELYTLTFEQINHLWGSLGGRQMPFAMYKLRLVAITERLPVRIAPVIEEVDITLLKISDPS